nr:DUF433 domain-containing protein [Sinorhizobium meliloti]
MRGASERLDDLAAAREIVTSPDVLGGTPVIRGTRAPVYDVAASVAAGHSVERILEAWKPGHGEDKARLYLRGSEPVARPAPRLRRHSRRLGHRHGSSRPPS